MAYHINRSVFEEIAAFLAVRLRSRAKREAFWHAVFVDALDRPPFPQADDPLEAARQMVGLMLDYEDIVAGEPVLAHALRRSRGESTAVRADIDRWIAHIIAENAPTSARVRDVPIAETTFMPGNTPPSTPLPSTPFTVPPYRPLIRLLHHPRLQNRSVRTTLFIGGALLLGILALALIRVVTLLAVVATVATTDETAVTLTPDDGQRASGGRGTLEGQLTARAAQTFNAAVTSTPDAVTSAALAAAAYNPARANALWTPFAQNFDGVAMALVPAGCFMMGSTDVEIAEALAIGARPDLIAAEQPAHEQCFEQPFWIDLTEVTNATYAGETSARANRPRTFVTWTQAREACARRGARLPTEREWEYAARGHSNLVYPWGNTFEASRAVSYASASVQSEDVGSRPGGVSWVGALDLSGNVREWTSSLPAPYPYTAETHESDDETQRARVLRGGAWRSDGYLLRAAYRDSTDPSNNTGFRCARDA